MKNKTVSSRTALILIAGSVTLIGVFEWRTLYALDHPPMRKISCVSCHSDTKTLKAMADKAGDPYYLVKRGDLKSLPPECLLENSGKNSVPKEPAYGNKTSAWK